MMEEVVDEKGENGAIKVVSGGAESGSLRGE